MRGRLDPTQRRATVVGAGFAGMLAAYELDRAGFEVTLLEASPRAGGLIETKRTEWGIAEAAAHSLLVTPAVRELCADLGVELIEVRPDSHARYIRRGGKMRRFPLAPLEVLRTFWRAYVVLSNTRAEGGTLETWARRHLGAPALEYLLTPFVRGIYGARPSELIVAMAFPSLVVPPGHSLLSAMLARAWRGALARALGKAPPRSPRARMMAPREGMGAITGALEARLRQRLGTRFRLGEPVRAMPEAPNVILAVPANAAADLVAAEAPELSRALRAVPYTPLVSVTAFARLDATAHPPRGVGVLLPEGEPGNCLGVLFNSSAFEGRVRDDGVQSFTVMLGGSSRPELATESDARLTELVHEDLARLFGIAKSGTLGLIVHRWPRAVPRYGPELAEAWRIADATWCARPGRVLFGNYAGQVSLRGMVDSVRVLAGGLQRSDRA